MCCSGLTSRGCWVSPERLPPFKVTQSFNKHVNIFRLPCKKMSPSALVGLFGRFKFKPNSQHISTFLSHKKNGQKPKSWVEFHVKNIVTSPISLSQIYCKFPHSLSFLFLINPKVFDTNNLSLKHPLPQNERGESECNTTPAPLLSCQTNSEQSLQY